VIPTGEQSGLLTRIAMTESKTIRDARPLPRRLKTAADPCGSALQRSFLSAKAATGECLARNKDRDMNHNNIRGAKKAYK